MMTSAFCAISTASSRETRLWLSSPSLSRMMARRVATLPLVVLHQLVAAGVIDGVVHRGAAAGAQHAHAVRKRFRVVGEVLRDFRRGVEADDEGAIEFRADDLVQELDGGFLLELEAVAHGVAGVDQQAYAQRQVGLVRKERMLCAGLLSSKT